MRPQDEQRGGGETSDEPAFSAASSGLSLPSSLAIIGLGLMGGSLALALKARAPGIHIIGITRSRETLHKALARRAIDTASEQLDAVREANLIILAAPVRTILRQIPQLVPLARDGTLILDLGSTKRAIVAAMDQLPARLLAVGGHPMCGKEVAGFDAAEATLYHNKVFILTPTARSSPEALQTARTLAETIGSRVVLLDAARHDEIVGAVSHLPYVVAASLVTTIRDLAGADPQVWEIAASGFRDTSRLAASDVPLMLDILLTNREPIVDWMRRYVRHFTELANWIEGADEVALHERLAQAAHERRRWGQRV